MFKKSSSVNNLSKCQFWFLHRLWSCFKEYDFSRSVLKIKFYHQLLVLIHLIQITWPTKSIFLCLLMFHVLSESWFLKKIISSQWALAKKVCLLFIGNKTYNINLSIKLVKYISNTFSVFTFSSSYLIMLFC